MIQFNNLNQGTPFKVFKNKYDRALKESQQGIEAISISSFNSKSYEVESRFVNLKFIINDEFIFFTNYDSPKALSFQSHDQIAGLIYWPKINTQIRMKAKIKKTSNEFNQKYFFSRENKKNALAISSNQSKPIQSYDEVVMKYNQSLKNDDLKKCPKYWGGYSFSPFEIEFWEGNEFRLNKRHLYKKDSYTWSHSILEP